jgi:predicted GIY-YIG superfamily endonuclease
VKGARLTRKQPIELGYLEKFPSQKKALQREWDLKHTSPYNQKDHKLGLIKEFQQANQEWLAELNQTIQEQYSFLESFVKILKKVEREMSSRLVNNK